MAIGTRVAIRFARSAIGARGGCSQTPGAGSDPLASGFRRRYCIGHQAAGIPRRDARCFCEVPLSDSFRHHDQAHDCQSVQESPAMGDLPSGPIPVPPWRPADLPSLRAAYSDRTAALMAYLAAFAYDARIEATSSIEVPNSRDLDLSNLQPSTMAFATGLPTSPKARTSSCCRFGERNRQSTGEPI